MKKKILYIIIASMLLATYASAQFPIRIPKIKIPKIEAPKTTEPTNDEPVRQNATTTNNSPTTKSPVKSSSVSTSRRQMVLDDGYTFLRAEPVKVRNSRNNGDVDVGWYLIPKLRLMGTFPDNSGFRLKIKQKGKELSNFFCGSEFRERKAPVDSYIEDFGKCSNVDKAIKEMGWMDVEIYYVDGETDAETLVRKHKIDVHKAEHVRGFRPDTYPGVSDYFIQRYAENSVGIIYDGSVTMSHLSDKKTTFQTYIRCSVNGKRIEIARDRAWLTNAGGQLFTSTALIRRDNPRFSERITFAKLKGGIPINVSPGKWECSFIENGVTYRTIRFEVGSDNEIIPHPEQSSGNINLYHGAFLVEVEIPAEVTEMDKRSMPMPDAGIFYGIPWTTPEGKAAAAKIPKRGNPYLVLPK